MRRQNIAIRLKTDVEEILVEGAQVTGIRTANGEIITADNVICNGDPPTIYREMLPSQRSRRKKALPESMTKYSMGLFVLFFGTKKQYPDVAHHTIWMGKRYKSLLDDIFNKQILTDDFSFICIVRPPQMPVLRLRDVTVFMCYALCPIFKERWTGKKRVLPCKTEL